MYRRPVPVGPDLVFFKNGRIREAWNLNVSSHIVSYRYRDFNSNWIKESLAKKSVKSIRFSVSMNTYFAQEASKLPRAPVKITEAARQPLKKKNILLYGITEGLKPGWVNFVPVN